MLCIGYNILGTSLSCIILVWTIYGDYSMLGICIILCRVVHYIMLLVYTVNYIDSGSLLLQGWY